MVYPLKSRWLKRRATAFQSIVLPPTPRARSEPMPSLPGFMVGMWRFGKSNGRAWVLKSVRVFTGWTALDQRNLHPALSQMASERASASA